MANFRRTNYLLGDSLKDDACLLDSPDSYRRETEEVREVKQTKQPITGRAHEAMVKHRGRFQRSVPVLPSGTALSLIFQALGPECRCWEKLESATR